MKAYCYTLLKNFSHYSIGKKLVSALSAYKIILKKRDGKKLTQEEIKWFINGHLSGDIPDYQMSALLMAIYFQGATSEETAYLTDAMLYSGETLSFKNDPLVIDKHSTGGIGDKASFVIAPIAAACGVKVPMIAGRGLGHTGGTVDKVESIKNFKTSLSSQNFIKQLHQHRLVLIGQTENIAPADKKIYALRDVTGTVESIPLITASIMSKKLAEGANGLVMDVKFGQGAFMEKKSEAKKLAKSLRETAKRFGQNIITFLSDMNQPLGHKIGNSLEIIESIETLKGKGPKDLEELSLQLAAGMILLAKLAPNMDKAYAMAKKALKSGEALKSLGDLISAQGGDKKVLHDYSLLPVAKIKTSLIAQHSGYLHKILNKQLGLTLVDLGGGRKKAGEKIDLSVGLEIFPKLGQKIKRGDILGYIYHHQKQNKEALAIKEQIENQFFIIKPQAITKKWPLIDEVKIQWS